MKEMWRGLLMAKSKDFEMEPKLVVPYRANMKDLSMVTLKESTKENWTDMMWLGSKKALMKGMNWVLHLALLMGGWS